jgi:hypothetical protein
MNFKTDIGIGLIYILEGNIGIGCGFAVYRYDHIGIGIGMAISIEPFLPWEVTSNIKSLMMMHTRAVKI